MSGLHDRLVNLEKLVQLIATKHNSGSALDLNNSSQPHETPHLDALIDIDGSSDSGSLRISASELHYVNGDHWAAILDGIADLKDHFDREEQLRLLTNPDQIQNHDRNTRNNMNYASGHSGLLYGGYQPASRAEILAALPPKGAVDRYISHYFNRVDLVSCKNAHPTKSLCCRSLVQFGLAAIHGPTFLQEVSDLT